MCAFFAKLLNVPTEPPAKEFKDPVFLVGAMRSGTTLLMNTLSEHPQLLKVGFELNKAWTEIGGAPIRHGCSERTEEDLKPEYINNMTAYFTDYLIRSKSLLRHLSRISQKRFFGSGGVFYDWDNVLLLNKNPHLSNKVRYLYGMYPKSKYIVIVRSPHAQSASIKMFFKKSHEKDGHYIQLPNETGACWSHIPKEDHEKVDRSEIYPGNFNIIPQAWLRLNKTMFKHLEHVPEDQKVVIAYEDLMNERADSLHRIFEMLQLKDAHRDVVEKMIERERKIHNTSTKGNPLEKWKKHLTDAEQQGLNELLSKNKVDYEYIKSCVPNADKYWR